MSRQRKSALTTPATAARAARRDRVDAEALKSPAAQPNVRETKALAGRVRMVVKDVRLVGAPPLEALGLRGVAIARPATVHLLDADSEELAALIA